MKRIPEFCVVGHPNKGKSSIVSTLTENEAVLISAESGTTEHADKFTFTVDGQDVLALTDTPGFQRARQILSWLKQQDVPPHQRPQRVQAFLDSAVQQHQFKDEVELLSPIMQGAGIMFVTDASGPVSASDLAEMEILRWTGQPRLAVINPMHNQTYHQQWRQTLDQYFQWVREFDPYQAPLQSRVNLISAMSELVDVSARQGLQQLTSYLQTREQERLRYFVTTLVQYWCDQMCFSVSEDQIPVDETVEHYLQAQLNAAETSQFQDWLKGHGYHSTAVIVDMHWVEEFKSLMDTQYWSLWGLSSSQLLWVSGASGMAAGSIVDVSTGGSTLMLGALTGGALGAAGGWLISRQKPGGRLRLPGMKTTRRLGPVQHTNFPYVVMARALSFVVQLWSRTHARRDDLVFEVSAAQWTQGDQVKLLTWCKQLQANKWKPAAEEALTLWVTQQLHSALEKNQLLSNHAHSVK